MATESNPFDTRHLEPRSTKAPAHTRRYAHPLVGCTAVLLGLFLGLAALYGLLLGSQHLYADRMLPSTYALGIDLSGLTLDEATQILAWTAPPKPDGLLLLEDGSRTYETSWRDAGLVFDPRATAESAYRIGRTSADRDPRRWLRLLRARHEIPPAYRLDAEQTRQMLAMAAPALAVAPEPSALALQAGQVVAVPGAPGRELDIDASLANIVARASQGDYDRPAALVFRPVPPIVVDAGPLQEQVDALIAPTIIVETYDLVEDRTYRWQLERETLVDWVRLRHTTEAEDASVAVAYIDEGAVAATVERLAQELGQGRRFRAHEAVPALLEAHAAGGGTVALYLSRDPGEYVVQAGDTGEKIAARHGMPLWTLQQANPGLNLDLLRVGQRLVIPSQDVLTPLMPVPHKRIVIDVDARRLRAYEHGQLLWDWVVAVGRESSPTHPGIYQVLAKEEMAYASLWDLRMPNFISVYEAGPGFYNGIHALPFLSSGYRLWEQALGTDASYGCVVLGVAEAEQLYHWSEPGIPVIIQP